MGNTWHPFTKKNNEPHTQKTQKHKKNDDFFCVSNFHFSNKNVANRNCRLRPPKKWVASQSPTTQKTGPPTSAVPKKWPSKDFPKPRSMALALDLHTSSSSYLVLLADAGDATDDSGQIGIIFHQTPFGQLVVWGRYNLLRWFSPGVFLLGFRFQKANWLTVAW